MESTLYNTLFARDDVSWMNLTLTAFAVMINSNYYSNPSCVCVWVYFNDILKDISSIELLSF